MRQRRSQHLRLAFWAGRSRSARVDARFLDELRDRVTRLRALARSALKWRAQQST
jgi:hypothetical protein